MEKISNEIEKQRSSNISIVLILVNLLLLLIFLSIGKASEDRQIVNMAGMVWAATVLIGIYAFSYPGKPYRIAKWLFGILLLVSIVFAALVMYLAALGHGFKN